MKKKFNSILFYKVTIGCLLALSVAGLSATYLLLKENQNLRHTLVSFIKDDSVRDSQLLTYIETLRASNTENQNIVNLLEEKNSDLARDLRREEKKLDDIEDEFEELVGTVGDLVKLSETDEELLQKYSKVYFLNENFVPSDLGNIAKEYLLNGKQLQFHKKALPFLEELLEEAEDDDIELKILSAYRSFNYQQQIKQTYVTIYGTGANTFSADQGYSEHQLGSTVDFSTQSIGTGLSGFEATEEFEWLQKNAYKYGFILSYPKDNAFYQYEPWHWRFVGEDLARDLRKSKKNFYEVSQRDLDDYLLEIFD